VYVIGQPKRTLLNQVEVGTMSRDDELVKDIILAVCLHSNHLTACWMNCMMNEDRRTEQKQGSMKFLG
jgi:hypothetical protein